MITIKEESSTTQDKQLSIAAKVQEIIATGVFNEFGGLVVSPTNTKKLQTLARQWQRMAR